MTDPKLPPATPPADSAHAGALLRAARHQQGLHIAALAAAIKVTPAKLEALEAGRYHELPDTTFTRALALTVCRVLKIDAAPVLAQLPGAPDTGLARVDSGLNTPFRERPGRADPAEWAPWRRPVLWLVAVLLVAAAAFVLVPSSPRPQATQPAVDIGTAPVMPPGASAVTVTEIVAPANATEAAPLVSASVVASAPVADAAAASAPQPSIGDAVVLRALQSTWVQAVDGSGQTLMARVVPAGETVELTATPPLRLRIGNAQGTELRFRGQPVDLAAATRDNIANLTLP